MNLEEKIDTTNIVRFDETEEPLDFDEPSNDNDIPDLPPNEQVQPSPSTNQPPKKATKPDTPDGEKRYLF